MKQYFNMNVVKLRTQLIFCSLLIKTINIEKVIGYIKHCSMVAGRVSITQKIIYDTLSHCCHR